LVPQPSAAAAAAAAAPATATPAARRRLHARRAADSAAAPGLPPHAAWEPLDDATAAEADVRAWLVTCGGPRGSDAAAALLRRAATAAAARRMAPVLPGLGGALEATEGGAGLIGRLPPRGEEGAAGDRGVQDLQASSTKKKRRLKMNKHKVRKRKKRDRKRA